MDRLEQGVVVGVQGKEVLYSETKREMLGLGPNTIKRCIEELGQTITSLATSSSVKVCVYWRTQITVLLQRVVDPVGEGKPGIADNC